MQEEIPDGVKRRKRKVMKKVLLSLLILVVALGIVSCTGTHVHTASNMLIVKEATCGQDGMAYMTCSGCGEIVNTITLPKTEAHTEIIIPGTESTCLEHGLTDGKKCSTCGELLVAQKLAPLKAHTEEIIPAVASTCMEYGLTEGKKCSVCDEIIIPQEKVPLAAHTYDNQDDAICNLCKYVRYCVHYNTKVLAAKEATCINTGLTEGRQCLDCDEILVAQEVIPLKDHTAITDARVEPSCTSTGLTEGSHCSVCEIIIVEQFVLGILEHTESDWIIGKKATTIETGWKYKKCTVCNRIIIREDIPVLAASEGLRFELIGDSYSVVGIGNCADADIKIPNTYEGLPVTSIGDSAFKGNTSITNIIIPDSVTSIGNRAFDSCVSLESVKIPNSVTTIGAEAFSLCFALTNIEIPDSVTSINSSAFWGCNKRVFNEYDNGYYLGNENNPYYVLIMGKDENITSCNIHSNTKIIASDAFWGYKSLMSVEISGSVVNIGAGAFRECEILTNVEFEENIQLNVIEKSTFYECISLESIKIPDSVKSIENQAFYSCESLTNVDLGNNSQLITIGNSAFRGCSSLPSITIPDTVTTIGTNAFSGCRALASITIPDSLTTIGANSFYNCDSLKYNEFDNAYYLGNKNNPYYALIKAKNEDIQSCNIHSDTKVIAIYAFDWCESLESIKIPASVTNIGREALSGCTSLTSINFGGAVEQWNAIELGEDWNYDILATEVVCSDGTVSLE